MLERRQTLYIVRQMVRRFFADGISQASAELAYFLLFSFFPLLMFLNSVLAQVNLSSEVLHKMNALLPKSIVEVITNYLSYLGQTAPMRPMIFGILLTLFFLSRAMRSLLRTVNRLYRVQIRAGGLTQMLMALFLTVIFLGAILASLALVVVGRAIAHFAEIYIAISPILSRVSQCSGYLIAITFVLAFLLLFHKIVPNVNMHWKDALPGTLFSAIGWVLFSAAFSFYVDHLARYSLLYGSLGVMIVLMLWLYLTGMMIIMGAQLNHVIWSMHHVYPQKDAVHENKKREL